MLLNTKGQRLVFFCFICSKLENRYISSTIPKDHIKFIFLKVQLLVTMFLLALLIVASIIKLKGQRLVSSCFLFLQSWKIHTDLTTLSNASFHIFSLKIDYFSQSSDGFIVCSIVSKHEGMKTHFPLLFISSKP
jgi:hypothetical protein